MTPEIDPKLFEVESQREIRAQYVNMKSPSSLGVWTCKVLWLGTKAMATAEYDENLKDFCK